MWCAHEFTEESRICVRCGALVRPAEHNLENVRRARAILNRCHPRLDPFVDSIEDACHSS